MNNSNGNDNESGQQKPVSPQQNAGVPEAPRPEKPEENVSAPAPDVRREGAGDRPPLGEGAPLPLHKRLFTRTWLVWTLLAIALVVCIGAVVIYQVSFHEHAPTGEIANETAAQQSTEGKVAIKVFYPSPTGLVPEERWVEPSEIQTRMVESAVIEYLKGPSNGAPSYVPEGTRLLGLYRGSDGIIYMDFSHEFRSNFQGDAYGEFLLLRGLYESVMSNAKNVSGLKVLIDGKEVDTIGGHISLEGTLGSVVSSTMLEGYEGK